MICSRNALTCHPETPCRHVRGVSTRVQRKPGGALAFAFALDGDLARLRIPARGPDRRADRLWEHTCFEAFIAPEDAQTYCEFNFAPSREWAAYAFRRYRDGKALELAWTPAISVRRTADRLELDATIRVDRLPGVPPHAPLRLGLSAVVEDEQGHRAFWALRHPPGQPDFHHRDAFALEIDPPDADLMNDPAAAARQ